jgi:hypothetical protein
VRWAAELREENNTGIKFMGDVRALSGGFGPVFSRSQGMLDGGQAILSEEQKKADEQRKKLPK